jgi:hypothetical protein
MSRARTLADYVSSGDELADKAPLASPTFTGTVAIPNVANLETAVVANTAKVTNYNQTVSDINALDVTELGTVTSANLSNTAIVYPAGHIIGVEHTTATTVVDKDNTTYTTVISDSITVLAGSKVLINISCPIAVNTSSTPGGGLIEQSGTAYALLTGFPREVMDEHHASSTGYFGGTFMSGVLTAGSYTFAFKGNRLSGTGTLYFCCADPGGGQASIATLTLYEIAQ